MTAPKKETPPHRTLFAIDLGAQRARKRMDAPTRAAAGAGATSDVRRHRPMVVAAAFAMVGVLVGWRLSPATPVSRGSLALPHSGAEIRCQQCHGVDQPTEAATAAACKQCHGDHPSRRTGHRGLAQEGALGCLRCHDVHGADQGVRFVAPDGVAMRYGVGAEVQLDDVRLPSAHDVTVPLVPLARCAGECHDPGAPTDPIARCVSAEGRVSLCFDEHQSWSAVVPPRPGGVCAEQHDNDRFAAWDAAREVAAIAPEPPTSTRSATSWLALVGGGLGALFGGLGYAGVGFAERRRARAKQDQGAVNRPAARIRLPQIDTNTCLGCYACVDVCPYDVFTVERYVAKVERPDVCCGLTLCEQVCPNGSLVITDGEPIGSLPRLGEDLQSLDAPGVFLAGDVTGLPLIKNAIRQGAKAVEHIAASLPPKSTSGLHDQDTHDLVIVGAGPAGISAALKAKELGLSYAIIEQGTVAQSIRSFPRGKLVFDQPLELPVTGKLWLAEATKEELLEKWTRVIRQERIEVGEGTQFVGVAREGDALVVQARQLDEERDVTLRCVRLLLAVGMRGSPRKLSIALSSELESKVFYHLADAREFSGQHVAVVGLGDVAMECAIALAHQPGCTVTVMHRGAGFSRGKKRNIDEIERLIAAGRLQVMFNAEVAAITPTQVTVSQRGDEVPNVDIDNDALFVMIGSAAPSALLEKAGVKVGVAL